MKLPSNMHLSSYLASLRVVTRKAAVSIIETPPQTNSSPTKHCILIHGWASDGSALRQVRDALIELPQAADCRFWDVTYDTTWTAFPDSARLITEELKKSGHDFSNAILIGYSMGGLVARQMVADGFPCKALVSLCTPHHGPVRWVPVPTRGPRSLAKWSHFIKALNAHPGDIKARKKYHFFAVTFWDKFGFHKNDGMVTQSSALGMELGEIAWRQTMHLKYSIPVAALMPFDPHWRAMFPKYIRPAIRYVGELLKTSHEPGA